MSHHHEKLEGVIKEYAGDFVVRESAGTSLITITKVILNEDNKKATIFFTTIPESKEEAALGFLKRNRGLLRDHIMKNVKTHSIPFLDVELDKGEKEFNRINQMLRDIDS